MENQLTWNNFYKHPRFWRHIIVWAIFFTFVFIIVGIEYYNAEKEPDSPDSNDFPIFFFELILLIYSAFYAYNKLITREKYVQLFSIIDFGQTLSYFQCF